MADSQRKTANLFDKSTWNGVTAQRGTIEAVTNGFKLTATSNDAYTNTYGSANPQCSYRVVGGETYTLSWEVDDTNISGVVYIFTGTTTGGTVLINTDASQKKASFTIPSGHNYVAFRLGVSTSGDSITYTNIMLNEGSTVLPYEPYGWVHSLRKLGTSTDTLTTLPADVYADGNNATVGLVGNMEQTGTPTPQNPIQPSECGDRTGNLFDEVYPNLDYTIRYLPIYVGEGTFTASTTTPRVGTSASLWVLEGNVSSGAALANSIYDEQNRTITAVDGYITIAYRITSAAGQSTVNPSDYNTMLNTGSTALSYEPHGYKIPISSGGNNLFDSSTLANDYTLNATTGLPYSFPKRIATLIPIDVSTLTSVTLTYQSEITNTMFIYAVFNGSTLVSRVAGKYSGDTIDVSGGDKLYISFYSQPDNITTDKMSNIMLNTGSTPLPYEPYNHTTTPVYLGEVQTTRKIKKLVLTGEETNWNVDSTNLWHLYINNAPATPIEGSPSLYCTHYEGVASKSTYSGLTDGKACIRSTGNYIWIRDSKFANLNEFKTWLSQQYANGTPVTVWYVLATETTGIVNEPLRKIGDYADSVSVTGIPTTSGSQQFDIDTTLKPSEVSLAYTGWHDASVKEKSRNLFDYQTGTPTAYKYLDENGNEVVVTESAPWYITDYIPIPDGVLSATLSKIGGGAPAMCAYDASKNYITGIKYNTGSAVTKVDITLTSSTPIRFIRFSYFLGSTGYDDLSTKMLNTGSTALPYEPYWK